LLLRPSFRASYCSMYCGVLKCWTCPAVHMHALEGLACARASLRPSPCMQGSALTSPSLPRALRQAFSRMLGVTKNENIFSMGRRLRCPTEMWRNRIHTGSTNSTCDWKLCTASTLCCLRVLFCAHTCAQRPGLTLVSLRLARMPRPSGARAGRLTSPACHACGSASAFRARFWSVCQM
jgi:hypothetical protein